MAVCEKSYSSAILSAMFCCIKTTFCRTVLIAGENLLSTMIVRYLFVLMLSNGQSKRIRIKYSFNVTTEDNIHRPIRQRIGCKEMYKLATIAISLDKSLLDRI
jgi:hypothetical protein